jgi:hypothetical protein
MTKQTNIEALIQTIPQLVLDAIKTQRKEEDSLWSAEKIAQYLMLKKTYVQSHVITHPAFPKAVSLPTGNLRGCRRWIPKEVKAWALRWR